MHGDAKPSNAPSCTPCATRNPIALMLVALILSTPSDLSCGYLSASARAIAISGSVCRLLTRTSSFLCFCFPDSSQSRQSHFAAPTSHVSRVHQLPRHHPQPVKYLLNPINPSSIHPASPVRHPTIPIPPQPSNLLTSPSHLRPLFPSTPSNSPSIQHTHRQSTSQPKHSSFQQISIHTLPHSNPSNIAQLQERKETLNIEYYIDSSRSLILHASQIRTHIQLGKKTNNKKKYKKELIHILPSREFLPKNCCRTPKIPRRVCLPPPFLLPCLLRVCAHCPTYSKEMYLTQDGKRVKNRPWRESKFENPQSKLPIIARSHFSVPPRPIHSMSSSLCSSTTPSFVSRAPPIGKA
ncbi:hypothetical protein J3F84DRAFT_81343 [Trichoderma pleuroticola]